MNPFALSGSLAGLTSLGVGLFVYSKHMTNRLNKLWFLFTASVAVFGFSVVWIALEKNQANSLWAWRVAFSFGVLWIPILFYHFVLVFCGMEQRKALFINYILCFLFFPLILFSSLFFGGVRFVFSSFYYSIPGSILFYLFFLWWSALVVYSHYLVYRKYQQSSGIKRNQFKSAFLAFSLPFFL
ncbi:MAG: hypothetical protein ACE5H1_08620, partial [Thermodesulfobacteriota bacterium]